MDSDSPSWFPLLHFQNIILIIATRVCLLHLLVVRISGVNCRSACAGACDDIYVHHTRAKLIFFAGQDGWLRSKDAEFIRRFAAVWGVVNSGPR